MRPSVSQSELESAGLPPAAAARLTARTNEALQAIPEGSDPHTQVARWLALRAVLLGDPDARWAFEAHRRLYRLAYEGRSPSEGPGPAWVPSADEIAATHLGAWMRTRHARSYADLHRWSVEHREEFWTSSIKALGIVFRKPPTRILDPSSDPAHPKWLPGAELNIAESCFRADPQQAAIVYASEATPSIRRMTYRELKGLSARIANGLDRLGLPMGARIAVYLPMTPESVAIYLGIVLSGRCVVGIADTAAPPDLVTRLRIADARAVFTIESYRRDGKDHGIYEKVVAAHAPRAVVLSESMRDRPPIRRSEDLPWDEFLDERDTYSAVPRTPADATNILFSSGTTKDPKAIPWTQTTPIKAAADAYFHHDVHPSDLLAWPTSFGWMMGPWLTYASLVNGAGMGLYVGATQRHAFGEFVSEAGVTILGVVPKLVRSWKADRTMEGLDWSRIRLFSSTAEPSTPDEMLYLMSLAGYKPIVEYCGGTEVGGGYLTGTLVEPCVPSEFTTPTMGIDFQILDEGRPSNRGEVFLVPPSIGLSTDLLNYDHDREYFVGVPEGPSGERLRRHGDSLERIGASRYRHLGRIDDMINLNGVKTSSEEIRNVLGHALVYDTKPVAVDVDGSGQHRLVVYAVPRNLKDLGSADLRDRLRRDFARAIKEKLNPLLAHVEDVVLVAELPQAGPGKTRTTSELRRDYLARVGRT